MILSINTSTTQFGLTLMDEQGTVLTEHLMSGGKGHFKALMPALDFMLKNGGLEISRLRCIAVVTGPGSFTGLRVGLSLAKGLCHALSLPIAGVSSLEAMAGQVFHADLPVIPVLTSRRGEAFTARFRWDRGRLVRESEDMSMRFDDFPEAFPEPVLFVGNDYKDQAPRIKKALGPGALLAPASLWHLRPSHVGSLGLKKMISGRLDDPHTLAPVYLRPPDIRPNPFPLLSRDQGPA